MANILFVCTGNICRSPMAEGVLRHLAQARGLGSRLHIDSAGTHGYHVGEAPDRRAVAAARARGIAIENQRARQFHADDFARQTVILALDQSHLRFLNQLRPHHGAAQPELFLDYAGARQWRDVADPYYGNMEDFERTLDMLEQHMPAALDRICNEHMDR